MARMVPANRPQWPREKVAVWLAALKVAAPVALLAARGYFRDSMGAVGRNDHGIYDDAVFLIGPNIFASYNANTDPSRDGVNPKVGKPFAELKPGVWNYMIGKHKGDYTALVQADPVTVVRGTYEETGWFGINVHRGSVNSTSSEGCQTIHPTQWPGFIAAVQLEMMRCKVKTIPYALVEVSG